MIPAIFEAAPPDSVLQSADCRNAEQAFGRSGSTGRDLVKSLSEKENVAEKMKANTPLEWVQKMNNIRSRAAEVVHAEVVFV